MTGQGLSGPPCQSRGLLDRDNPPDLIVQKMCVYCGRVTARVGDDGLPWCGGERQMGAGHNRPRYRDRGVTL